jgi:hypothetical protein
MIQLTNGQLEKLQQLENKFIAETSGKKCQVTEGIVHYDEDYILATNVEMLGNPSISKEFETLTKNRHKADFAEHLIDNFDEKMEEIGLGPLSEEETNNYIGALAAYSTNLRAYNELFKTKLEVTCLEALAASYGSSRKSFMNKDAVDKQLKANETGDLGEHLNKSGQVVVRESIGESDLKKDMISDEPITGDIEPRISFTKSVSDFFAQVHRTLVTGLKSWWTGEPLENAQKAYDLEHMTPEEKMSGHLDKAFGVEDANDLFNDDELDFGSQAGKMGL